VAASVPHAGCCPAPAGNGGSTALFLPSASQQAERPDQAGQPAALAPLFQQKTSKYRVLRDRHGRANAGQRASLFAAATIYRASVIASAAEILNIIDFVHCITLKAHVDKYAWTGQQKTRQPNHPGADRDPDKKLELHMNFLPKAFRAPELFGLLAAIPAAFAGSVLFVHMLDAASRIVV
jgi:hypothetical protein